MPLPPSLKGHRRAGVGHYTDPLRNSSAAFSFPLLLGAPLLYQQTIAGWERGILRQAIAEDDGHQVAIEERGVEGLRDPLIISVNELVIFRARSSDPNPLIGSLSPRTTEQSSEPRFLARRITLFLSAT